METSTLTPVNCRRAPIAPEETGLLSKLIEWNIIGLVLGLLVLAIGVACWRRARRIGGSWLRRVSMGAAGLAAVVGALGTAGGGLHLASTAYFAQHYPPRGRIVDVGGYKMHIFCEGEVKDLPPIVWMSPGRGEGLFMYHLHRHFRSITRSCMYDRTGTGWSDAGPKTQIRLIDDVNDLAKLLRASGEDRHAPFVLVGHSAGGPLAANFAAVYPKLTAGALLLDPSAPLHDYIGRDVWCHYGPEFNRREAWAISFGLDQIFPSRMGANDTTLFKGLADVKDNIAGGLARNPIGPWLMATSASCRDPLGSIFTPGALGDLPLMEIVQPERSKAQVNEHMHYLYPMTDFEQENYYRLAQLIEHQYVNMSTRSTLLRAPSGSTHMFPYEHEDFVVEKTLELLKIVAASGGWSPRPPG